MAMRWQNESDPDRPAAEAEAQPFRWPGKRTLTERIGGGPGPVQRWSAGAERAPEQRASPEEGPGLPSCLYDDLASGGGALPAPLLTKMETAFGTSFADVGVSIDSS